MTGERSTPVARSPNPSKYAVVWPGPQPRSRTVPFAPTRGEAGQQVSVERFVVEFVDETPRVGFAGFVVCTPREHHPEIETLPNFAGSCFLGSGSNTLDRCRAFVGAESSLPRMSAASRRFRRSQFSTHLEGLEPCQLPPLRRHSPHESARFSPTIETFTQKLLGVNRKLDNDCVLLKNKRVFCFPRVFGILLLFRNG